MESSLKYPDKYPADYVKVQISPVIRENKDMTKEIIWTYLVARKYENNHRALAKILCGEGKMVPENSKIWLEAYLQPTRENEGKSWMTRADLAIGHFKEETKRKNRIQSSGGEWVCIMESKWYDDIQTNAVNNEGNQLLKIIDHALLIHDNKGNFPKSVYVTLVTPRYFKESIGKFSLRDYRSIYYEYKNQPEKLNKALSLCQLPFLNHNIDTLINRTGALKLNWVTFEDLLGFQGSLVEFHRPGKYKVTIDSWEKVLTEIDMKEFYDELSSNTVDK